MLGWRVWSARVRELWLNALCSRQALLSSGQASFGHRSGHRSKTTCLSAFPTFPSISNNLSGQDFHGTAYHGPRDKRGCDKKDSYARCRPEQCHSRRASSEGEACK